MVTVQDREISIKAQANFSSYLIMSSFKNMNCIPGNDATDHDRKRYCGEYLIDEEASAQN